MGTIVGAKMVTPGQCFQVEMRSVGTSQTWPVGTPALSPVAGLRMATASVFPGLSALLRNLRWGIGCSVAAVSMLGAPPPASALGSPTDLRAVEPTPRDIEQAAKYFDDGRAAFRKENYVEAAEAFEKADALAPNPKVLLLAIQSRELGGHVARAATLAALAEQRHPKDPLFTDLGDLLKTAREGLHFLTVTCESPCQITVGNRLVHGAAATRRYLFLEEGKYRIRASWGQGEALSKYYEASNGTRGKLRFEASGEGEEAGYDEPAEASRPESNDNDESSSDAQASATEGGEGDWGDGEDWGDAEAEPEPAKPEPIEPAESASSDQGGVSTTVFWSGVAATGILAGVSTWSGIDTLQHPGTDAVVARCVGLGESCPEYQEGLQNQLRTNILWGVTGGVGVITALIGVFWTDWDGSPAKPEQSAKVTLGILPVLSQQPTEDADSLQSVRVDGSLLTATGRF